MEESLEYYKKSIVLNPEDKDAKINYELLKQTLQQQQDQQQHSELNKKKEAEAILNALRDKEKINQKKVIKEKKI